MKELICSLAIAALLGACEQKTDIVAPDASPVPEKSDKSMDPNTLNRARAPALNPQSSKMKTDTPITTISSPTP